MNGLSAYITEWISSGRNSNSRLRFPPGKMTVDKTANWLRGLGVKELPYSEYSSWPASGCGKNTAPGELAFVCGPCLQGAHHIGTFWINVYNNTGEVRTGYNQEITIWEDIGEGRLRQLGRADIEGMDIDKSISLLVDMVSNPKKKIEL